MFGCNLVAKHSFLHYNDLINDPGFLRIKDNNTPPDESTIHKVLDKIEIQNITELKKSEHNGPLQI